MNAQTKPQAAETETDPAPAQEFDTITTRIDALEKRRAELAGEHQEKAEALGSVRAERSAANVSRHVEAMDTAARKKADGKVSRLDAKIRKGEHELGDLADAMAEIDRRLEAERKALERVEAVLRNQRVADLGLRVAIAAGQYETALSQVLNAHAVLEEAALAVQAETGDLSFSRESIRAQGADRVRHWLGGFLGMELGASRYAQAGRDPEKWSNEITDRVRANLKPED